MSEGRGHRARISRCESRCVVVAPSPFTKGQSVPGKPQDAARVFWYFLSRDRHFYLEYS